MAQKKKTTGRSRQQRVRTPSLAGPDATSAVSRSNPIQLSATLPSIKQLVVQSLTLIWRHWRVFGGIAAVYGLLTVIFVTGIGSGYDVGAIRDQFSSRLVGSLAAYTQLVINPTGSTGAAAGVYQFVLLLLVSLALIWSLRQVMAGHLVTVKDAFYRSMYPLVPCLLVLLVVCLQLLPMIIGSALYQLVINNKIAVSSIEVLAWGSAAFLLSLVSLYFLAASVFSFYIATLPDMLPLKALRLSRQLVAGRRWGVLRKLLVLPLILLIITAVLVLPLIVVLPSVAGLCTMVLSPLLVVFSHTYVYTLYRGLMDE